MIMSHLWSGLTSTVMLVCTPTLESPMLSQSKTSWNVSLAGMSSGKVTQTGTILIPPAPNVRVGLVISKVALGACERFPANVLPVSWNVSSPFPGFSNLRISLVLSLTLRMEPSSGLTTSAPALKTCNTCKEIDKSALAELLSLWLKKCRIGGASNGKSRWSCPFWPVISSIVPLIDRSPLTLQFQPTFSIPAVDISQDLVEPS